MDRGDTLAAEVLMPDYSAAWMKLACQETIDVLAELAAYCDYVYRAKGYVEITPGLRSDALAMVNRIEAVVSRMLVPANEVA